MYTPGRKLVFQLLLIICAVTLLGAQESSITLSELRQIATESRKSVTFAHMVYVEESISNEPPPFDKDTTNYKIYQIQTNVRRKVDLLLDRAGDRVKMTITDLRDIDKLLKEWQLPPKQKINVPKLRYFLMQGDYDMEISDGNASNGPLDLGLVKRLGRHDMFKLMSLGVIDEKIIPEDANSTLTKIESGGKALLRIQHTGTGQNAIKRTIDCDPSLGYRFRRIQWHSEGQLIKEIIADDYRDVNDGNGVVPYPFLYIDRSFDKDGRISRETKYVMEMVELGVDLSPDDFKIFVPAGTDFMDDVISMRLHKIEQSGYMGIDDALSIGEKWLLKH